jgi:hypothetical protein
MACTMKDGTGSLFANDRKTSETHPDRTGSIMVAGVEYYLSGWLKKTKDGKPYPSLSVKPKAEKSDTKLNDSVPF